MNTEKSNPGQALSGNFLYLSRNSKPYGSHFLTLFFILALSLILNSTQFSPADASEQRSISSLQQKLILLDFESDKQLDELGWKCGTSYERSHEYAVSGRYSLKMEMYPRVTWPGFSKIVKTSWAGYDDLSFNIFNPTPNPIQISYRIDDRHGNPPYTDRANGRFLLKPGPNTIRLNLKELKTSDGKRHLDLSKICSFLLFLHNPQEKITLYLDDLILTKPRPVKRVTDQNHAPGTKGN
jgi:hypothetical protein